MSCLNKSIAFTAVIVYMKIVFQQSFIEKWSETHKKHNTLILFLYSDGLIKCSTLITPLYYKTISFKLRKPVQEPNTNIGHQAIRALWN